MFYCKQVDLKRLFQIPVSLYFSTIAIFYLHTDQLFNVGNWNIFSVNWIGNRVLKVISLGNSIESNKSNIKSWLWLDLISKSNSMFQGGFTKMMCSTYLQIKLTDIIFTKRNPKKLGWQAFKISKYSTAPREIL